MTEILCKIYFALTMVFDENEAKRIVKMLIDSLNL